MKTVEQCVYFYNKIFFEPIKQWNLEPSNYVIAGGAVRDYLLGEKVKDIDIFTNSEEAAVKLYRAFINQGAKDLNADLPVEKRPLYNLVYQNRWFQIVNTVHYDTTTTETIANFDFTMCCAQISSSGFDSHVNFFQDVLSKHLRINNPIYPLNTLSRMQKYIKRGYTACNGTLLELTKALQTVKLDEQDENTLEFYPDGTPRFIGVD